MTTAALAAPATMHRSRVLAVVKLHFLNPTTVVWTPLYILGIIFAMNWLLWLIIGSATQDGRDGLYEGTTWSGASMFLFVWLLVLAVQAMNRTFHFALGFGATRRDYFLGTAAALVLFCVGWAILFGVLGAIEDATDGWGLGGSMFTSVYFGDDGPIARTWYAFLLMLFFTGIGLVAGALFVRWRTLGLIGFFAVLGFVLIGGIAWLTLTGTWGEFGAFFAGLGFAGSYPLLLVPTVIAGGLGYVALRGATARS